MPFAWPFKLFEVLLVLVLWTTMGVYAGEGGGLKPNDLELNALILQLGNEKFSVRTKATERLYEMGEFAWEALEKASESQDPEIRSRAKELLSRLKIGTSPDWPPQMLQLVDGYTSLIEARKVEALQELFQEMKANAIPFLLLRLQEGSPWEQGVVEDILKRGGKEYAPKIIRILKRVDPNEKVKAVLALALGWEGEITPGIELAKKTLEGDEVMRSLTALAIEELVGHMQKKEYNLLIEKSGKYAELLPSDARFLYLLADGLDSLNRMDERNVVLEKAGGLNAQDEVSHFLAGELLSRIQRIPWAIAEWEKVLKISPDQGLYDINAYLRLGTYYVVQRKYREALDSLEKALAYFRKGREEGQGLVILQGNLKQVESRIQWLKKQIAASDVFAKKDEIGVNVSVAEKKGRGTSLSQILQTYPRILKIESQSPKVRILDLKEAALNYDVVKHEFMVCLNGVPRGNPIAFEVPEDNETVLVQNLDCYYLYRVDLDTGKATQKVRFEKDYIIRLEPQAQAIPMQVQSAKVNGRDIAWGELLKGTMFDVLPDRLDVELTGSYDGKQLRTIRFNIPVEDPELE